MRPGLPALAVGRAFLLYGDRMAAMSWWWIVGLWLGGAVVLAAMMRFFHDGGIRIDRFNESWRIWIGRYLIVIADPDGAWDPHQYGVKWSGVQLARFKLPIHEGAWAEIILRLGYKEWQVSRW